MYIDDLETGNSRKKAIEFVFIMTAIHSFCLIFSYWIVPFCAFFLVCLLSTVPYLESQGIRLLKNNYGDKLAVFVERFQLFPYESIVAIGWFIGSFSVFVSPSLTYFFGVLDLVISALLMQKAHNVMNLSPVEKKHYQESMLLERLRLAWSETYRNKKKVESLSKQKSADIMLQDALERASAKKVFSEEVTQDREDAREHLRDLSDFKVQQINDRLDKWLVEESARLQDQRSQRPYQLSSERAR